MNYYDLPLDVPLPTAASRMLERDMGVVDPVKQRTVYARMVNHHLFDGLKHGIIVAAANKHKFDSNGVCTWCEEVSSN